MIKKMTRNSLLARTALSLGLAGALAVSAASPSLAWTHRSYHGAAAAAVADPVADVGFAADATLRTAAALGYDPGPHYGPAYAYQPVRYSGVYAYEPGFAMAPAFPYAGAYAAAPAFGPQGPEIGQKSDGAAIYPSQLGPGCPLTLKMDDRC
ncbi:MAG TPA: hypothetical protein VG985_00985 [Xanthobacteraceae bacterium]|nr:hypothetical protein [Xanthobacteraceae bacterium]